MTDRIKEKFQLMRAEAEAAIERAEKAEKHVKTLEQELLAKEQEITSLQHRLGVMEATNEKHEAKLAEFKTNSLDSEQTKQIAETLNRKVQLLEEELDAAEKNVKETVEKLRQVDVKAEHYERKVVGAEKERDAWVKKHDELDQKYRKAQADLDELEKSMGEI